MQDIDYAINLFNKFKMSEYDREDKAENFLAMMAFDEICQDNMERLLYIISQPRFNECCFRGLFLLFFNSYRKVSKDLLDKYFTLLLEKEKFNFPLIFQFDRNRSFPNIFAINKEEIGIKLLQYLQDNKIYIYDLIMFFEESFRYNEDMPEKNKLIDLVTQYMEKSSGAGIIKSLIHSHANNESSLASEYVFEHFEEDEEELKKVKQVYHSLKDLSCISKNETKQENAFFILCIGFMTSVSSNIGKKRVQRRYKKTQSIVSYPSVNYIDTIPDCFNNPYKNFVECLNIYNDIKNCKFSDKQLNKITELYYSLFSIIFD